MKKVKMVKVSELKFGQPRDEVLPEGFIKRVIAYKEKIADIEKISLEETILNFQRDYHPLRELEHWEWVANCYEDECRKNPNMEKEEKLAYFEGLLWGGFTR